MAANRMQEEVQTQSAKQMKEMARDNGSKKIDGGGSIFMVVQYQKIKVHL